MKVILQNIIFDVDMPLKQEMFYRSSGKIVREQKELAIGKNTVVSTDTYMNLFDYAHWKKHTSIENIFAFMRVRGTGKIQFCSGVFNTTIIKEKTIQNEEHFEDFEINLSAITPNEEIFFRIISDKEIQIKDAYYFTETEKLHLNKIHLSVVICTFQRKDLFYTNLTKLTESFFFDPDSDLYGKMSIRVVDNASEIKWKENDFLRIYHNPNTGGSGGFSRGIEESVRAEKKYNISHIVLMDDDVRFINETFYRLYAFLLLLKEKYNKFSIGGRMFRLDKPDIQYTALENWNGGNIIHSGFNRNMCQLDSLYNVNCIQGDYTGWWFGCFPIDFCRENQPLPFFLHCDDVEYGLRQGCTPLVLNGIQVWHETYENRKNPLIEYYDTRNSIIVNTIYEIFHDYMEALSYWKLKIGWLCSQKEYLMEYAAIIALFDFMKGCDFFLMQNKRKKLYGKNSAAMHIKVILLWRIAALTYRIKGKKAFSSYKKLKEKEK